MSVFTDIRQIAQQQTEMAKQLKAIAERLAELIELLKADHDPVKGIQVKEK